MENSSCNRNSSIELLRIVCIVMVFIQHIFEKSMLGGFNILAQSGDKLTYIIICFIYGFSRIAVNVFILISGYFSVKNEKRPIGKAINLLIMVSTYAGISYLGRVTLNIIPFSIVSFVSSIFPKNYYVSLYITLYFISPYLNVVIKNLDKNHLRKLIFVLLTLFSIWSTSINAIIEFLDLNWIGCFSVFIDGTGRGFSIVNFIMLYIIGAYLQLYHEEIKFTKNCLLIALLMTFITTIIRLFLPNIVDSVLNYDSIFIIIQSITFFCIFLNLKIKNNKIINCIAKRVFGMFLLHYSIIKELSKLLNMELWLKSGLFSCIVFTCILVILGMIISGIIDYVMHILAKPLNSKWKKSKLYNMSFF